MDVFPDYFPSAETWAVETWAVETWAVPAVRGDTRAQQSARLMNEAGPQPFADQTNRLERSVQ